MKVIAIEVSKNVDKLNIEKLVELIQTYDFTLDPPKKNKVMTFKSFK